MRTEAEKHAGKHMGYSSTRGHTHNPADQYRAHGLLKDKLHDFSAVSSKSYADADRKLDRARASIEELAQGTTAEKALESVG